MKLNLLPYIYQENGTFPTFAQTESNLHLHYITFYTYIMYIYDLPNFLYYLYFWLLEYLFSFYSDLMYDILLHAKSERKSNR